MQFLVIFTPPRRFADEGPPSDFAQVEAVEEVRAQELYGAGSLRQAWALDTARHGAVVIFEADSADRLQEILHTFPMVEKGYSEYRVLPVAPYPGFATTG